MNTEIKNIYGIIQPKNRPLPLIFDSPHSGRIYPEDFKFACSFEELQKAEDNYVDDLFDHTPLYGAHLLKAYFPRTYIDVNRCEYDIDENVLSDKWPHTIKPTQRSHAGIGLIRRILKPGIPVYNRTLSIEEVLNRIDTYYRPYHESLKALLDQAHYDFGSVWHINCHSMPSGKFSAVRSGLSIFSHEPDFVLGNRDGTTSSIDFTRETREFLRSLGYRVAINNPYRGVELIRKYSSPAEGRHSLQIEINKALYWDEKHSSKNKNYEQLKKDLEKLTQFFAGYVKNNLIDLAAD
jgi:N-formylglutamate amidohydrolase